MPPADQFRVQGQAIACVIAEVDDQSSWCGLGYGFEKPRCGGPGMYREPCQPEQAGNAVMVQVSAFDQENMRLVSRCKNRW